VRGLPSSALFAAPQHYANGGQLQVEVVTFADRAALCPEMRNALLVVILVATVACGAYRFPGPGNGMGTVSGQVIGWPCGPVQPVTQDCMPGHASKCVPSQPNGQACGGSPIPGLELVFTNGTTSLTTKTDSAGVYSIELHTGTWTVKTPSFTRIISGPQTLVVSADASIVANYVVDTGIRAAA
jgi:hypothetical protein